MHIPDGYLGPQTYVPLWAIMLAAWSWASRKIGQALDAARVPFVALGAAFSFIVMMFNVPAPGGTTGHAVGSVLIAVVLGPWAAALAVSVALIVQALLFGDGGVTAIGANCFNMAVVMPVVGYGVYRVALGGAAPGSRRQMVAAGLAGYVGLNAGALLTAIEVGLQPLLAHRADGTPLYCPYPLSVTVPVMLAEHLLVFGWIEAAVTGFGVRYLGKVEPSLFARSASR